MKTVLHVGVPRTWTSVLGPLPWPLAPLGNRPLLEYWFEVSLDFGVSEVHLVLGDGAQQVEAYAGDGSRWGVRIQYSFLRDDRQPLSFLQRNPGQWREGVLFVSGPLFPRRLAKAGVLPPRAHNLYWHGEKSGSLCAVCPDAAALDALLGGLPEPGPAHSFEALGLDPLPMESVREFFALNLQLAGGEMARYLAPGYGAADGSCLGYNVIIPPSVEIAPSVIVGNDCRIGALASVGPSVVLGNHVVVDRQAQLERCVVLSGTYVGRRVELREKIVAGRRLIDPADGEFLDLEDTWLLASIRSGGSLGDLGRAAAGWVLALVGLCVQLAPFALLYTVLRWAGLGRLERRTVHGRRRHVQLLHVFVSPAEVCHSLPVRLFYALGLDLTPRLAGAVCGRWWLCGHEPLRAPEDNALRDQLTAYFPAVFSYATARGGKKDTDVATLEARYVAAMESRCYAMKRGVLEDLRILWRAFAGRAIAIFGEVENG